MSDDNHNDKSGKEDDSFDTAAAAPAPAPSTASSTQQAESETPAGVAASAVEKDVVMVNQEKDPEEQEEEEGGKQAPPEPKGSSSTSGTTSTGPTAAAATAAPASDPEQQQRLEKDEDKNKSNSSELELELNDNKNSGSNKRKRQSESAEEEEDVDPNSSSNPGDKPENKKTKTTTAAASTGGGGVVEEVETDGDESSRKQPANNNNQLDSPEGVNTTNSTSTNNHRAEEQAEEDTTMDGSVVDTNNKEDNQQGGEPAVVNNNNAPRRTSPRRNKKQQQEEEDQKKEEEKENEGEEDQKDAAMDTNNNNEEDNAEDVTNCCKLCNNPEWENKIYYKCGTVLKKYFPKTTSNPNPGWYKGTIHMHYLDSESDDEDQDQEAENSSIIYNEIQYEDGDMENITQDDLKDQLTNKTNGRKQVKILKSSATNTSDNNNKHDQKWLEKFNTLQKFKEEKGHTRVPRHYKEDQSLGNWVFTQRDQYKKDSLAEDRKAKLQEIDFDWDTGIGAKTNFWEENYDKLKQYKDNHGNTRVPHKYGLDPSLGSWVHNQRNIHKKGKMASDRLEKLNNIGFEWDPGSNAKSSADQSWQEKFDLLQKFKTENGHTRVPQLDPTLGNWVAWQRKLHKKGTLAPDRIEKLNNIGFIWAVGTPRETWDERFNKLKQFHEEKGHCRVPARYSADPSLAIWVGEQRGHRKKGKISQDRIEKLEALDFDWDPKGQTWDEMFDRFQQFHTENGHCKVPSSKKKKRKKSRGSGTAVPGSSSNIPAADNQDDPPTPAPAPGARAEPDLGRWVERQRERKRKGTLSKVRIEKLEEIKEFEWGPTNPSSSRSSEKITTQPQTQTQTQNKNDKEKEQQQSSSQSENKDEKEPKGELLQI